MLMLSIEGWLNGISATAMVLVGIIFGLYCIYESKKGKIKLLFSIGLAFISGGLMWLADVCDFFSILLTGNNLSIPFLSFMWLPLLTLFFNNLGVEFVYPKRKLITVLLLGFLSILFELSLFLDTKSYISVYPVIPGEDLVDHSLNLISFAGIITLFFSVWGLFILGFGLIYQSIKSKGVVRKKFLLLSIGILTNLIFSSIDGFATLGVVLVFIRILAIIGYLLIYLGLKEESIEPKEKKKKEVLIEKSIFRLSKRPDQITEEEVSISKEKKICLVCKGKVGGFNFICNECGTFYCEKCAKAMVNLENVCWVCNTPFDESKPSEPYLKEEEGTELKLLEDIQKKHKK